MRPTLVLSLFGLSILSSGCALIEDSSRNVVVALTTPIETHRELARNRLWAETAWQKTCASTGPRGFSEDYARGFKDGYAEYLYRGGDGQPPVLAPKHYRHLRYQTPQGYLAIADWFAGYRHGAAVAHDSGARRWITGPAGLLPDPPGLLGHEPPESEGWPEPIPLPMPQQIWQPKLGFEQQMLEGVTIEVKPPAFPVPLVEEAPVAEPTGAKILGVSLPRTEAMELPQQKATIKGISALPMEVLEPKATIRKVFVPPAEPEAAVDLVRAWNRTVNPEWWRPRTDDHPWRASLSASEGLPR